jgi:hypothetical protein
MPTIAAAVFDVVAALPGCACSMREVIKALPDIDRESVISAVHRLSDVDQRAQFAVVEFGKCSGNGHQISGIAAQEHWDRRRLRQSASSAPYTRIGHTVCSSARRSGAVGFHYCLWPTESSCDEILNEPSNP